MNIKIQGGGSGTYANTGSCTGVTTYLQHKRTGSNLQDRQQQQLHGNCIFFFLGSPY